MIISAIVVVAGPHFFKRRDTNLVAAKTNTPVRTSTPSNSVRNCKQGNKVVRK